jgi:hypothetical protein
MSCACVINDPACAVLIFAGLRVHLADEPAQRRARVQRVVRGNVAFNGSHLSGEATAGADPWDRGTEVGELLGRALDKRRRTRRGDRDHDQRIGNSDLARELMADIGGVGVYEGPVWPAIAV